MISRLGRPSAVRRSTSLRVGEWYRIRTMTARWSAALGPAELGEGGFRMNPIGVVAKDDQHLGGGVGTDAKALTQRRRGLGGESTQVTVVVHDLDGESEPATGERPEGMFRRGGRRIDRAAPPSAASFEEAWSASGWRVSRSSGGACQWQPKTAHLWQPKTAHFWGGRLGRSGHSPGDARREAAEPAVTWRLPHAVRPTLSSASADAPASGSCCPGC